MARPYLPYLVLGISVLAVSTAALLIKAAMAEGVSAIAIAFWRMAIAGTLMAVLAGSRRGARQSWRDVTPRTQVWMIAAGFFLALHIAAWISSLAYTSVASSTALVTTNPVWLALFAWLFMQDKPDRWIWLGVGLSVCGSALVFLAPATSIVAGGAPEPPESPMLGNTLALIGSLTVCGYLLIGRHVNSGGTAPQLLTYVSVVYLSAAVLLLAASVAMGASLIGFSATAWAMLIALALGPQVLGHSGINWSLRHLPPTLVAIAILGEPLGSAFLAYWLLGEQVTWLQGLGFGLIVLGIIMAAQTKPRQAA
jgi:drug/metabolite transporter (DMT)-like permease